MPTSESGLAAPPINALVAEMVATLSYAAHAYLTPSEAEPDVFSARLRPDERSALGAMLTRNAYDHCEKARLIVPRFCIFGLMMRGYRV